MPWHADVAYLRERAAHFRRIATQCETVVAAKLYVVAIELEAMAAEIEVQNRPPH
jgi:hypothetical protein